MKRESTMMSYGNQRGRWSRLTWLYLAVLMMMGLMPGGALGQGTTGVFTGTLAPRGNGEIIRFSNGWWHQSWSSSYGVRSPFFQDLQGGIYTYDDANYNHAIGLPVEATIIIDGVRPIYVPALSVAKLLVPVFEPGTRSCEVRVRGLVESVSPEGFLVAGKQIVPHAGTQYQRLDGVATSVPLSVGQYVEVLGCEETEADPRFLPRVVTLYTLGEDDGQRRELVLSGPVESVQLEGDSFTLRGATILTSDATVFRRWVDAEWVPSGLDELVEGELVRVRGVRAPQIAIFPPPPLAVQALAVDILGERAVPPPPGPRPFAVSGYLQDITEAKALVVDERVIATNNQTRFRDASLNAEITLDDLEPGNFLLVRGAIPANGNPIAVEVVRVPQVPIPARIFGRVTAVGDATFVVDNVTIQQTERTRYFFANGIEAGPEIVEVGVFVEVDGIRRPGIGFVAERVTRRNVAPLPCGTDIAFHGSIDSVEEGRLVIGERVVILANTTLILSPTGARLAPSELVPGLVVRVEGSRAVTPTSAQPAVNACRITVVGESPVGPPPNVQLVGEVASIDRDNSTFKVRDLTTRVGNATVFESRRSADADEVIGFADLTVGDLVLVSGNRLSGGEFVARRVVIQEERTVPPIPSQRDRVVGLLTAVEPGVALTVDGERVLLPAEPEPFFIFGYPDRQLIAPEDLVIGDLLEVRGLRASETTPITAREIFVRAVVISSLDQEAQTLEVGGRLVGTDSTTEIRILGDGSVRPGEFADLTVGDLIRLRAQRTEDGGLLARHIRVIRSASFLLGEVGGFRPAGITRENGRPVLTTDSNQGIFGFITLPEEAFAVEPNILYEITARVTSNVADPTRVPTTRLRTNNTSLQKGQEFVVDSNGPSSFVPTPGGREIKAYYVPAQIASPAADPLNAWFASLDLLNDGGLNEANSRTRLDAVRIRPIPLSALRVAETLVEEDFNNGAAGWEFMPLPGTPAPVSGYGNSGGLDVTPSALGSIGWWTGYPDAVVEGGHLYRGRFLVRSNASAPGKVPTFRVRLNLRSLQMASVISITSNGEGEESPTEVGRLYDVYLYVPNPVPPTEGIFASLDLIHVDPSDEAATITLDHFTFERLEIAE